MPPGANIHKGRSIARAAGWVSEGEHGNGARTAHGSVEVERRTCAAAAVCMRRYDRRWRVVDDAGEIGRRSAWAWCGSPARGLADVTGRVRDAAAKPVARPLRCRCGTVAPTR
ncbi:hypothetical protein GCM10009827_115580 [Dactylosporangium maewongense]|uniref:Uncharacterized protein n=1 Tax=Dactylosporangium maewongense TaxID=634393 RepID=A0ABP4PCU2_9ACTN